jgi:hypothetical protein
MHSTFELFNEIASSTKLWFSQDVSLFESLNIYDDRSNFIIVHDAFGKKKKKFCIFIRRTLSIPIVNVFHRYHRLAEHQSKMIKYYYLKNGVSI